MNPVTPAQACCIRRSAADRCRGSCERSLAMVIAVDAPLGHGVMAWDLERRIRALRQGAFVVGCSTVFIAMGASGATDNAVVLLAVYAMGLAVPFLLAAGFTGALVHRMRRIARVGGWLQYRLSGVIMVLMGIAVMAGQLGRFSYWLLAIFAVLSRIG